ncbi:hypothetical protein E4U16_003536 [Claviceps sp. LM84 group G4]|nr:hypothetical protein E4U16_003536 [Claviceps sp. LM84 group G4]
MSPCRLDTHVLTVDANVIHKVDTSNPANLCSMWTVFSRCADSVEQGRRLENLSWRIWQREQLIDTSKRLPAEPTSLTTVITEAATSDNKSASNDTKTPATIITTSKLPAKARKQEVPQLSGSVESLADEEAADLTSISAPLEIRPRIQRLDSSNSRKDRHISSDDFEKMIVSIVKDTEPLSAPSQTTAPTTDQAAPSPEKATKEAIQVRAPTFPDAAEAASAQHPLPEPSSSPAAQHVEAKKQPARFALGGSCSSGEQAQSIENLENAKTVLAQVIVRHPGDSGRDAPKSSAAAAAKAPPANVVAPVVSTIQALASAHNHSESAIDSDTETESVDESAIDDDEGDDSSDWEDSVEESGKSSVDDKQLFQRVESKVNLTSKPSLISLMFAQDERTRSMMGGHTLSSHRSTPAHWRPRVTHSNSSGPGFSPSVSGEPSLVPRGSALKPISEIPRSSAQPITTATAPIPFSGALSPRTTRRNMLATELTESLRRHLLWERRQKTMTANASLRRRHTSQDVHHLRQYPDKPFMKPGEDAEARSLNHDLDRQTRNGYHAKGW